MIDGLGHLQAASHQKRVLVVLSDGDDNASMHSDDDDARARRAQQRVDLHGVDRRTRRRTTGNSGLLKKLAQRSGGVAYTPRTEREVVEAFREIAGNIRRGYSIGYVPTNTVHDGRYRRVKVTVRAPGHKNLSVIARDGYLAPHHTDAH